MTTYHSLAQLAHELGHAVLVNRKVAMDEAVRRVNQEMAKRGASSSGMRATKIDEVLVDHSKAAFEEIVQKYATVLEASDARLSKRNVSRRVADATHLIDDIATHARATRERQQENRTTPETTTVFLARLEANRNAAVASVAIEFGKAGKRERYDGFWWKLGLPGALLAAILGFFVPKYPDRHSESSPAVPTEDRRVHTPDSVLRDSFSPPAFSADSQARNPRTHSQDNSSGAVPEKTAFPAETSAGSIAFNPPYGQSDGSTDQPVGSIGETNYQAPSPPTVEITTAHDAELSKVFKDQCPGAPLDTNTHAVQDPRISLLMNEFRSERMIRDGDSLQIERRQTIVFPNGSRERGLIREVSQAYFHFEYGSPTDNQSYCGDWNKVVRAGIEEGQFTIYVR